MTEPAHPTVALSQGPWDDLNENMYPTRCCTTRSYPLVPCAHECTEGPWVESGSRIGEADQNRQGGEKQASFCRNRFENSNQKPNLGLTLSGHCIG